MYILLQISDIAIHISTFIPNDTFNLSRVCKQWLNILKQNLKNNNLLNNIENVQNNSYDLSVYLIKNDFNSDIILKTITNITSPCCLNMLVYMAISYAECKLYKSLLIQYCALDCDLDPHKNYILDAIKYNILVNGHKNYSIYERDTNRYDAIYILLCGGLGKTKLIDNLINDLLNDPDMDNLLTLDYLIEYNLVNIFELYNTMVKFMDDKKIIFTNEYYNSILEMLHGNMAPSMKKIWTCKKIELQ